MSIDKTFNILALGGYSPASGEGHSEVALLSITTEPSAPFAKGSKYYNDTTKKIYTAVVDDTWTGATVTDPSYGTFYQYNGATYIWDGNTLELFELEEYQKKLVSGVNIKTINGESILGSGNLSVNTYQSFNSSWITNTTFADFMSSVNSDTSATPGMAYLGELTCSGLPLSGNVEAVIEIQNGPNNYKTIHTVITSGTDAPYRWEYTYWNNGSSVSGWIGFQPQIIAGNNITIDADGKTINASVPSGVYTQDNLIAGNNIAFEQKINNYIIDSHVLYCFHFNNSNVSAVDNTTTVPVNGYSNNSTYAKFLSSAQYNESGGQSNTAQMFSKMFSSSTTLNSYELTIDFWAYIDSYDMENKRNRFIGVGGNGWNFSIGKTRDTSKLSARINIGGGESIFELGTDYEISSFIPTDNIIHHYALCIDSNRMAYYYVDGEFKGELDISNIWTSNKVIDRIVTGSYYPSECFIDELRISNICRWGSEYKTTGFAVPTTQYEKSQSETYSTINAPIMTGATALANGTSGTVPAPTIADKDKYLKGDGSWATLSGGVPTISYYSGTGTTITIADTSSASLVKVYKNGLLLRPNADGTTYDYSISGTTLTLTTALEATDTITLEVF